MQARAVIFENASNVIKHFYYTSSYREKQEDLSIFGKFSDVAPLTYAEHSAFCQKFRFPLLRGHIRSRRVGLADTAR